MTNYTTGPDALGAPACAAGVEADVQQAWRAMRTGSPDQALHISNQLLAQRKVPMAALPWAQASLVVALRDHLIGRSVEAADRLYRLMAAVPDSDWAMQLYLAMLQDAVLKRTGRQRPAGRVILGLGTGRSGSTSLTHLLAAQPDTCFSHEHAPLIPWQEGHRQLNFHLMRTALLVRLFGTVADVSHWWLPKLPVVLKEFAGARVVVLRRDRAETVASFMSIKGAAGPQPINHWMAHDGVRYKRNLWDVCYPKFNANSLEDAVGLYWDAYYQQAEHLEKQYPSNVRIFDVNTLSSTDGQETILRFCGYQEPVMLTDFKKNAGTTRDGALLWMNPFL